MPGVTAHVWPVMNAAQLGNRHATDKQTDREIDNRVGDRGQEPELILQPQLGRLYCLTLDWLDSCRRCVPAWEIS